VPIILRGTTHQQQRLQQLQQLQRQPPWSSQHRLRVPMWKSLLLFLALLASCLPPVMAEPRVVHMPITRRPRDPKHELAKRASGQKYAGVVLGNAPLPGLYFVNASVGTPGQNIQLQVDTGSSDIWMFGPNSCDESTSPCLGYTCKSHQCQMEQINDPIEDHICPAWRLGTSLTFCLPVAPSSQPFEIIFCDRL
jgi:Eukaryotic aspartyl protease